jgi:hypothetical protein
MATVSKDYGNGQRWSYSFSFIMDEKGAEFYIEQGYDDVFTMISMSLEEAKTVAQDLLKAVEEWERIAATPLEFPTGTDSGTSAQVGRETHPDKTDNAPLSADKEGQKSGG